MKFFVFAAGILLIGLLTGCEKGSESAAYPVTISFNKTSAVDSVFVLDTCNIQGKVVAEGPIKSVRFYRTYPSNSSLTDSVVSIEIDSTQMMNVGTDTCSFSINVPNVPYATTVNVVVTETNGHMVNSKYRVNIRTQNIIIHKNVNLGGNNGAGKSAIDLNTGNLYGQTVAGYAASQLVEEIGRAHV